MKRSGKRPEISLVVAVASNDVIGNAGALPWHLPDDLRNFRRLTIGKPVIMGRRTYESIGRPLPDRRNIVISHDRTYVAAGCELAPSPEAAVVLAGDADEVTVIGGSQVYAAFLPFADRVYLTRVHADVEGDVFFPPLDDRDWLLVAREAHAADAEHRYAFDFMNYERRRPGRRR